MRARLIRVLGGLAVCICARAFAQDLPPAEPTDTVAYPRLMLEARLAPGYDRIGGIRLRAEATIEYEVVRALSLRFGAATEFASFLPDALFSGAYIHAGSGGFGFQAESAVLLGFLPYSGNCVAGFKVASGFYLPWLDFAAGIVGNSHPGGYTGVDFLLRIAFKAAFDGDRLKFALEISDYDDFMRGSLSSIRLKLEGRYSFEGCEGGVDIECFPSGTMALSATWSRIMVGFSFRKAL